MARPTKLTDILVEEFATRIKLGLSYAMTCAHLGISYETFRRWRNEGTELIKNPKRKSKKNDLLIKFVQEVDKANAENVMRRLGRIDKASTEGKWQADAWFLERRFPEEFGRVDRLKLTGEEDNEPLTIKLKWSDQN